MTRVLFLFCLMLVASINAPAQVAASVQKFELNIKSQPLDQALTECGDKTGLNVVFARATGAEKIMSPGLKGIFTGEDALDKLLASTGLRKERLSARAFMVTAQPTVQVPPKDNPNFSRSPPKPVGGSGPLGGLEQVVVTGTNIPNTRPDASSMTPYFRGDIERSGAVSTDQFVAAIPQNFSLLNARTSTGSGINRQAGNNGARGTAIDFWGLGPGATLVLLNGQRLAPAGYDGSFIDVSTFPLSAMERVEVLADGASAIYGSDAVAGVVNFVLRRDFVGLETTTYYADATSGGGRSRGLSQLAGNQWSSGGVMLAYENEGQQAVDASSRSSLVPQSGPYQVIPSQARQSAVVTLHQKVAAGTELSADGFYGERDFSQDYISDPLVSTQSQGRAKMTGGSFTVDQELWGEWRTDVIGGYAAEEETVTTSASAVRQFFETRSTSAAVDWRANGPVLPTAGGLVRFSIGASLRWESFNNLVARLGPTGAGLKRHVLGAYGEALVPIVGEQNALRWAKRLELSLAIRGDAYRSGDSTVAHSASDNPKFGLLWSPLAGLALRGTYATSFRVAPLAQMDASKDTALVLPISSLSAPGTPLNTLYLTGGNSALRPEVAKSFTAGFDLALSGPESSFSATYFHVNYTNRIAAPPMNGSVSSIFSQFATLGPYIHLAPSAADIQAVYDHYSVLDPMHTGPAGVQAIFDSRLQNIASIEASGVELRLKSKVETDSGDLNFLLQGQYLAQLDNRAAPTTPYVPLVNTAFNPPRLRMKADADWSYKGLTTSITLEYTSSYHDTLVAGAPDVASWLILDSGISYATGAHFASTALDNTTVTVSVSNLMNRSAPYVQGLAGETLGYDPTNATPLGRVILFEVKKHW